MNTQVAVNYLKPSYLHLLYRVAVWIEHISEDLVGQVASPSAHGEADDLMPQKDGVLPD